MQSRINGNSKANCLNSPRYDWQDRIVGSYSTTRPNGPRRLDQRRASELGRAVHEGGQSPGQAKVRRRLEREAAHPARRSYAYRANVMNTFERASNRMVPNKIDIREFSATPPALIPYE
jgi:hypothetical protein